MTTVLYDILKMSDSSILLEGQKTIPFSIIKIEFSLSTFLFKNRITRNLFLPLPKKYNAHSDMGKHSLKGNTSQRDLLAAQKQLAPGDEPQMFKVSPPICILVAGVCTSPGGPVNKDRDSEGTNAGRDAMHYLCLGSWQNTTESRLKLVTIKMLITTKSSQRNSPC